MSATPLVPLTPAQRQLAEEGLRIVNELARFFARQWPSVPESDFVSAGHLEVVRSAQLYDPKRRTPFEVYLRPALNGVMQKLAKRERYRVQRLTTHLWRTLLERPSDHWTTQEVLERPPWTREIGLDEIRAQAADILAATLSVGTQQLTGGEDGVIDGIDRRDVFVKLRSILGDLTEQERAFVHCYYEESLSISDVAKKLGVIERTAYRMQHRVREKLAYVLRKDAGAPQPAGDAREPASADDADPPTRRMDRPAASKRGASLARRIATAASTSKPPGKPSTEDA